jgi:hypothetical protein
MSYTFIGRRFGKALSRHSFLKTPAFAPIYPRRIWPGASRRPKSNPRSCLNTVSFSAIQRLRRRFGK